MIDPYLYRGTLTLRNKLGITNLIDLNAAEPDYVFMRMKELNDTPLSGNYDFKHLCDIHKYIFQDLYEWAGTPRIIDILKHEEALKGDSVYYAKHGDIEKKAIAVIERMKSEPWEKLSLEQKAEKFSEHFADLWKVHPFRDGNTRAITHFCCQYADKNGIAIDSNLFADYSSYLRDCLVMANRGTLNPLRLMVFSAMQQGQKQKKQESLQLLKYVKKRDGR